MSTNISDHVALHRKSIYQLPFPLYLSTAWKTTLTICLVFILTVGLWFKSILIHYLHKSSRSKIKPINYLIWIDQLNSLVLSINLIFGIAVFNLDYPVRDLFGEDFCQWMKVPGYIYLTGAVIWSCLTAIYRVTYIRGNKLIEGEKGLLSLTILVGVLLTIIMSVALFFYEQDSFIGKLCRHSKTPLNEILILSKGNYTELNRTVHVKNLVVQAVSIFCGVCTVTELLCYISIFHYIYYHDNKVAVLVIKPKVLRQRNKNNVIGLSGQFFTWLMKIWFIVIIGWLSTVSNKDFMREVAALAKSVEFVLIPIVQIMTSSTMLEHFSKK